MIDLMFVHVPKTGGSSIRTAIEAKYGDRAHFDYADRPTNPDGEMNKNRAAFLARDHVATLRDKTCVYVHFWMPKYHGVPARLKATILREPVERLLSNYFFWKFSPDPTKAIKANALRARFHQESPSIEEFAAYPAFRRFYTGCFFLQVDMAQFGYIGDYADLAGTWPQVMKRLGLPTTKARRNVTKSRAPDYEENKRMFLEDAGRMAKVKDLLADDIAFYRRWAMPVQPLA